LRGRRPGFQIGVEKAVRAGCTPNSLSYINHKYGNI
jgi:hypothetical protein